MPRFPRTVAAAAFALACLLASPAAAQYYPKVSLADSCAGVLNETILGDMPTTGAFVGTLAGLEDPRLAVLFRRMAASPRAQSQVYGILGDALLSKKGIDPALMAKVQDESARATIVREANVSGILRESPVDAILAQGRLGPAATLTLVGELDRRGAAWDPALLEPVLRGPDDVAAGVAALLRMSRGDQDAWKAYLERLGKVPEGDRSAVLRALAEGTLIFDVKEAVPALLACRTLAGINDDASFAVIGTALRLDTPAGVEAWQDWVASHRTQAALVRAGLQLLASTDRDVPAGAFDQVRNGSIPTEAIANAGRAMRSGADPAETLIALLDVGHSASAEWALVRTSELPPEQASKVWRHLEKLVRSDDPALRPGPVLVAGVARELLKTDPASAKALAEWAADRGDIVVPVLAGFYESRRADGAATARALRGKLPRVGESVAVLILARAGVPMTDDDVETLGRAGAGGGDLDPLQQAQAAWYYLNRKDAPGDDAVARIMGAAQGATK